MALVCKDLDWSNTFVLPPTMVPQLDYPIVLQPLAMPSQLIYNNLPVTYYGNSKNLAINSTPAPKPCSPAGKKSRISKNVKNLLNKRKSKRVVRNVRNCVPLRLSYRTSEKRSRSDSDSDTSSSESECFISPPKRIKRHNLIVESREMRAFFEILSKLVHV